MKFKIDPVREAILTDLMLILEATVKRIEREEAYWEKIANLSHSDPAEFFKQEMNSGSAMADDPPRKWTKAMLRTWFQGNARGREIEALNQGQILKMVLRRFKKALSSDIEYGFKRRMPTKFEIEKHEETNLASAWMVIGKTDTFPGTCPIALLLSIDKKGRIVYSYKIEEGGETLTKQLKKKEISGCFPIDPINGEPVPWPKKAINV